MDPFAPGFEQPVLEPRRVVLPEATEIVATASSACALTTDGDVYCWGRSSGGALGPANPSTERQLGQVSGASAIFLISGVAGRELQGAELEHETGPDEAE